MFSSWNWPILFYVMIQLQLKKHICKLRFYVEIGWSLHYSTFNGLLITFFLPFLSQITCSFWKYLFKSFPAQKEHERVGISLTSGNACSKNITSNKTSVDREINIALLPGLNVRCKEVLSILTSYRITHPSSTDPVSRKAVIKSEKGCGSERR